MPPSKIIHLCKQNPLNIMEKKLLQAAKNLIEAINNNHTYLWEPSLKDTVSCIVSHSCEVRGYDNENNQDFEGIENEIEALENIIKEIEG